MEIPQELTHLFNWVQMTAIVLLSAVVAWLILRIYAKTLSRVAVLVRLLALEVVMLGVSLGIDSLLNSRYPMIFAIVATGMLTFYALLTHSIANSPDGQLRDGDMRTAVASSITTMYLMLVGYGVFLAAGKDTMDPLAKSLFDSFSYTVGVVIVFYFGSSAYVETKRATTASNQASAPTEDHAAPGAQGSKLEKTT